MSDSLRILTLNTQLRSYGMEALAQLNPFPNSSTEERAATISERILRSPEDYDVICLNEVFDEDARDVFQQRLLPKYGNAVLKADLVKLDVRQNMPFPFNHLPLPPGPWSAGLGFDLIDLFTLAAGKLEDSGLMLFSRLPFAQGSATGDLLSLLSGLGLAGILTVPTVLFCPYPDSNFDDSLAAKGVLYARLMRGSKPLHLLMSHTQAASAEDDMEHRDTREKQFEVAQRVLEEMTGGPPYNEEVVFCGDFNVNGFARFGTKANDEAIALFADEFSPWRRHMTDAWWWDQCPGEPALANHMPANCDPGLTTAGQRLDYFLRARFPGRMTTQHVAVAWDIAQAGPGEDPTFYTSDHLPLRLDLNEHSENASANTAKVLTPRIQADAEGSGLLQDGWMDWSCLLEKGSYGIGLIEGEGQVGVDVYAADNLSRPVPPFTTTRELIGDVAVTRYALPDAPVFIRVSLLDRHDELNYRLLVHRFDGTGPEEAIGLPRGVPFEFDCKVDAPHSLDHPDPDFDDHDCVWFTATLDTPPPGHDTITYRVRLDQTDFMPGTGDHAFGVIAAARKPGGQIEEIGRNGGGTEPVEFEFEHEGGARLFLLVRRHDPSFQARHFRVEMTSDVSYLYGNPAAAHTQGFDRATLRCIDETDGFLGSEGGSDDIAINVKSGDELLLHIANNDFLEFDDEAIRDVPIEIVRYKGDATFELVELDDLSPADRASTTIESFEGVKALPLARKQILGLSWIQALFLIDFGDGKYELTIVVSQEPPPGP
jgi:endonuclease/exonuclease/phosphatase family metal-dependent hydrolase